jgi:ubiquinone/menaquinone biosynthesis C-methylase UbiE
VSLYQRYVFPRILDWTMRQEPITRQRAKVVPRAQGRVLEIGIGSGLNLRFYDRARVERLYGLDPSADLQRLARTRAEAAGIPVEFLTVSGEAIPLDDASIDTVVSTFTLCSIPDVERALEEVRRVLRPGGELVFTEHGRAPDAGIARWQERLNPVWRTISSGCNMNRAMAELIRRAGLEIRELDTMYLPGPKVMTFNYWGSAIRA